MLALFGLTRLKHRAAVDRLTSEIISLFCYYGQNVVKCFCVFEYNCKEKKKSTDFSYFLGLLVLKLSKTEDNAASDRKCRILGKTHTAFILYSLITVIESKTPGCFPVGIRSGLPSNTSVVSGGRKKTYLHICICPLLLHSIL